MISKYVLLSVCVREVVIKRVRVPSARLVYMRRLNVGVLCTRESEGGEVGSRGGIGGLENVRNVEECNQNVPLCGKQQQHTHKKIPGR